MQTNPKAGVPAAVKGTMINAHIEWAKKSNTDLTALKNILSEESSEYLNKTILQTQWVPLRCLLEIDQAIAKVIGGSSKSIYKELGRYSAIYSLKGIYKSFIAGEPHRFFEKMSILHEQYMNFGRSNYEKKGERSGRIILDKYIETSSVYCASATGFYEEALRSTEVDEGAWANYSGGKAMSMLGAVGLYF